MSGTAVPEAAGLDRRFYAFTIDRVVAWAIEGLAVLVAWRLFLDDGRLGAGVAVVAGGVALVLAVFSAQVGLSGTTPGKAALGLRVVDAEDGTPVGLRRAALRSVLLGVATLPTFGIGAASLAWTATMDREHRRRAWHDHVTGTVVVDVRPVPVVVEEVDPAPRQIVNLTAMRLVPTSGQVPGPVPSAPAAPVGTLTAERTRLRDDTGPPQPSRWRIAFDTGDSVVLEGLALVGRRPEPREGEPVRHLLPLPSDDLSLSKTHAQVQVAPDGALVVMDRGSTNGSVLVRSGTSRQLPSGQPTTLLPGDEVRFGDRRMTVTRES